MADFAELGIKVTSTGAGKAQTDLKGVQSQAEKTEKSVLSLQKMISNLKSLLAIGVGGATISTLIQMADKMKSLSAQVKFVTKSVDEYNAVQKRLFDISQNTRSSLEATTTLYTKSARALQDYGYSQKQLLGFTETINKAMIVGGVGAQEQASALFQLSQALGSGRLQGDEFRTIAESAPIILDVVAEYMGKSRAEVKKLAGDGKLTSQVLFEAISGSAEKISQKFQTMPITFGESMTLMRNSMLKFIADLDTSTGITGALANLVAFLALNFSTLATAVGYATAAYIAYNAVSLVSNLKAALGGVTLLQAGFVGLAMAIRTATAAMIANPFGMLAIAIVGLIYVFDEFISDLETGFGTFNATWGDVAQGVWLDFKDIAVEVWDDVTNYIDTAVSQITESFGSTISSLGELFVALLSIAKSVINGLIGRFVLAYQTVVMAWNDFPSAMETLSISAINGLVSIIEKGINFILDKIKLLLGYLNKAASAVGFKNLFDLSYMSVELPKIEGSKEAKNFKDQYAKLFNDISQTDYLGDAFSSIENYISLAGARGKIHNKSAQLKNNKDADLSQQGLGVMPTTNTSDSANDKNKSGSRKGRENHGRTAEEELREWVASQKQKIQSQQQELAMIGMLESEKTKLNELNQLEMDYQKQLISTSPELRGELTAQYELIRKQLEDMQRLRAEMQADPVAGIKDGFAKFGDSVMDVMGNVSQITQNALSGMTDSLTTFVLTGKADFKSFAQSVISDITKMIVKMMIFQAIKSAGSAMGFDMSWLGGKSGGGYVYSHGGIVGFDSGGYTGTGGKYTPAGIVHKGEYVLTKEATSRLGVNYLDYLNYQTRSKPQGFSSGGAVGVPVTSHSISHQGNVSVKVINNGEPVAANVESKQTSNGLEISVELVKMMNDIADKAANKVIQNNFRAGGAFA